MPHIEMMNPEHWERVRTIRLRALRDAPDAFGSTLEREEPQEKDFWVGRLSGTTTTYLAILNGTDVGLVSVGEYTGKESASGLFSMWVAPEARGVGCGERLIQSVVDFSREQGFARVLLDVADENPHAIDLYDRMGFKPTGIRGTLPKPRQHIAEHERELRLTQ